jgi:hypothetical protein
MSPQVLLVSRDAMLLQTRQLILGTFFPTQVAGRVRDAEVLISTNHFELIILCYTLSEEECRRVIELAKEQKRPPRILILTPAGISPSSNGAGEPTMSESGPYYLLKRTAQLLGVDIRTKDDLVEA